MAQINKPEKKKKPTNNNSDKRKERQRYYNTPQWKALAKWWKMKYPLCEVCGKPAEAVHHIESPFKKGLTEDERWDKLLDLDNLMSICVDCHLEMHGLKDTRLEKYGKLPHIDDVS